MDQRGDKTHLGPGAEEPDVVDLGRIGALRGGEEERDGGDVGEFCGSELG